MAAGSSIFRLVHIPTRPLLSPVSEIYGVMLRACASGPERAVCVWICLRSGPFSQNQKTNWKIEKQEMTENEIKERTNCKRMISNAQ